MLLTDSEINTLIAACMLTSIRYDSEAKAKVKSTFLSPETLGFEAKKYKDLEEKLRLNFYEGGNRNPKTLNNV